MCVPARIWCNENNFMTEFKNASGNTQLIPDYQKAFDNNPDIRSVISAMEGFMVSQGYEVVKLENSLQKLQTRSARDNMTTAGGGLSSSPIDELNKTAKCDIIVDVYFTIKKQGPYKFVEFNVGAIDSYTSAPISQGNIGRGTAAASTEIVNQLEEAVLSFKDKFVSDMDVYFEKLFVNGRQIVIRCTKAENSDIDYETEFDGQELGELIENFMVENAFKGNFSLESKTENEVYFDRVFIPMTETLPNGNVRGTDANWFASKVRKFIESKTKEQGVKCKVDLIGLGEVNIIMGGKQ